MTIPFQPPSKELDNFYEANIPYAFSPIYGWKATPWQAFLGRPDLRTPVQGLFLTGHCTRPIHGLSYYWHGLVFTLPLVFTVGHYNSHISPGDYGRGIIMGESPVS